MKIGDIITITAEDYGSSGEGIAHIKATSAKNTATIGDANDYTVFASGVMKGETAEVRVNYINAKKNLVFAKVTKLIELSPERVAPRCPVHSACGGCSMQHISYGEQLNIKKAQIQNCLFKYAKVELKDLVIEPSEQFGYRNKLQLPVREEKGIIKIGFYKEGTHTVTPITHCPLHGDWAEKLITCVKNYMIDKKVYAYNEEKHFGIVRHIVARQFGKTLSVIIVINGKTLPFAPSLVRRLQSAFGSYFTLSVSQNMAKTNLIITSPELTTIYGEPVVSEIYNGFSVEFSPLAFLQVNNAVSQQIYKKVVELVTLDNYIVDAYSGTGIMTAMLAQKARHVIGMEIVSPASEAADRLKTDNRIHNITNLCGDVASLLPRILGDTTVVDNAKDSVAKDSATELAPATNGGQQKRQETKSTDDEDFFLATESENTRENDVIIAEKIAPLCGKINADNLTIVLDPPRKGCDTTVTELIANLKPTQIIYISCNPATLARDLNIINRDSTYDITFTRGYDMFPNTQHIETIVCLSRK